MEWKRRQAISLFGEDDETDLLDPSFRAQVNEQRSAALARMGVVCRLPGWSAVNEELQTDIHPPRLRFTNGEYASFCLKLMNSLSGPARSWAVREFFYGDIDRAWYVRCSRGRFKLFHAV
jgi:hypothetical protein